MAYSHDVYEKAKQELNNRRQQAQKQAEENRKKVLVYHPELLEIENELSKAGLEVIKSLGMKQDAEKYINSLAEKNLATQQKKKELLLSMNLPEDYLDVHYKCEKCNDTGFVEGKICTCHLDLLKSLAYISVCKQSQMGSSTFENFSMEYYSDKKIAGYGISPRERMQQIYNYCVHYADDFNLESPNIYMNGATGLGKTHLSLAIASTVINKGFTVAYGPAQYFFSQMERERFRQKGAAEPGTTEDVLLNCDLLVLDDLGTEMPSANNFSIVYNIINTRLLMRLPTIINSNVPLDELEQLYSRRVTSRIVGNYQALTFVGEDIRQLK